MKRRLLCITGSVAFALATVGTTFAQDTQTTTTTTQTTQTVQNADGTSTVIQYPANKEVTVNLTPTTMVPGASGRARIMRTGTSTAIKLDLTGLTGDATGYNLYAVDPSGRATMLGPITVNNGVGTLSTTTPLDKFMLVLSPDANLTAVGADTKVVLRSAVPEGSAVVPLSTHNSGGSTPSGTGDRVTATTTAGSTPAYNVPLLNIPTFKRGKQTHMRINFSGDLVGSHANAFILPRADGPTQIKMRFHDLKKSNTPNTRVVLWAVGPDNNYVKIGQIVNTGRRNETEIKGETALKDFGLFVTAEPADAASPTTPMVGTITVDTPQPVNK
jgi:hypothetical protein